MTASWTRRHWLAATTGAAGALGLSGALLPRSARAQPARSPKLTLAGPGGLVSAPLMHMAQSGALSDLAERVEMVVWRDPDQLRALTLQGQADLLAMPTNVAANLHNRGVPLTLLNVSVWGMLWLVSRRADARGLADFRGGELAVPFRGDMPDIVLNLLLQRQGLVPGKDITLRYVATPMEAMTLLLTRRVDQALLAEPAATMALRKTAELPASLVAPALHRSVDLQQEWGRLFPREPRIPQAGVALLGEWRNDPALRTRLQQAYRQSLDWCLAHPAETGALVARHVPALSAEAVADSIATSQLMAQPAAQARPALEFFFQQLLARQPGLVGGRLPGDDFYAAA